MSVEVTFITSGHVDPEEVRELLAGASERPAELEFRMKDTVMDAWEVSFSHPYDRRKARSMRFHRSQGVEERFRDRIEDGPYTYFSMGSHDGGERIMRIVAGRYGGYLMNDEGETCEWVEAAGPEPEPAAAGMR